MLINELFYSIQGEGPQVGMPAWFIRTTGCNLTCSFCDTKYALKEGKEMSIIDIKRKINNNCKNIVFSGGEPLLQEDLLDVIKSLGDKNIYIESNGTIFKSDLINFATFIVSPKPQFLNTKYMEVLKKWAQLATFKFVINNKWDFDEAIDICKKLKKNDDIYFMPLGINEEELKAKMISIGEWIKKEAPFVRLSPRLQIYLYGNKRGI
jgi:7-carboxy-7-deazaguanine synthase